MRNVLVLGAGQSAGFLIDRLLDDAERHDWFVTVGDRDESLARAAIGGHARGAAVQFDAGDAELCTSHVQRASVVVNLLPQHLQPAVARICLQLGRHLVSVSYRDREMLSMEAEAQRHGILFLAEVGLDPGLDLMSAARMIDEIREGGGVIESFESYGSGVPAPEDAANPLRYCITWNPRNVAMAGEAGAQYLRDGRVKIRPWHAIFQHPWTKEIAGIGPMEAYPNRDSLGYRTALDLHDAHTLIRGTLRYPGWCSTWAQIVRLGLPNEQVAIPELSSRSWAEILEMFLPDDTGTSTSPSTSLGTSTGTGTLAQRTAAYLGLDPQGPEIANLRWLGLFDPEPAGVVGTTAADAVIHLLRTRLALPEGGSDLVILLHEIEARFPGDDDRRERWRSLFVHRGDPGGWTAMSRTVGWPAAIAVRLLLTDRLQLTGCRVPTHPAVSRPILDELARAGLGFEETRDVMPSNENGEPACPRPS